MMNEKRGDLQENFRKANRALELYPAGTLVAFGPAEADFWWPQSKGSKGSTRWQRFSEEYFDLLMRGGKHIYIRGTAPLSQLDLRTGISGAGRVWYDHHFQDTQANAFKMSQILTNLVVVTHMLSSLRAAAIRLGRLPKEDAESIALPLIPDFGRGGTLGAEATSAQRETLSMDQEEQNINKLAALAGIRVPFMGDYYETGANEVIIYQSKDLSVMTGVIDPGKFFGPIVDYHSYQDKSGETFIAGLIVEFVDQEKTRRQAFSTNFARM